MGDVSLLMPRSGLIKPKLLVFDDPKGAFLRAQHHPEPYLCLVSTLYWEKWRLATKYFINAKDRPAFVHSNDQDVMFYLEPATTCTTDNKVGIVEIPEAMLATINIRFRCFGVKAKVQVNDVVSVIPEQYRDLFDLSYDIVGKGGDLGDQWNIHSWLPPNDLSSADSSGASQNSEPVAETSTNPDGASSSNCDASPSSTSGASSSHSGTPSSKRRPRKSAPPNRKKAV